MIDSSKDLENYLKSKRIKDMQKEDEDALAQEEQEEDMFAQEGRNPFEGIYTYALALLALFIAFAIMSAIMSNFVTMTETFASKFSTALEETQKENEITFSDLTDSVERTPARSTP